MLLVGMPVDDDEWNNGRSSDTRKEKVLAFLESTEDQGWSAAEIAEEIGEGGYEGGDSLFGAVSSALGVALVKDDLEDLAKDGEIKKKSITGQSGDTDYYRST